MLRRLARSFRRTSAANKPAAKQAAAVEQLEGRQMLAVSPVFAGTKIKTYFLYDGLLSRNQSQLLIPFTGNITIADQSKIQVRGYAVNPLSSKLGQIKKVCQVLSAQVLATDYNHDGVMEHSNLLVTVDRLVRTNSPIILYEGAFTDDQGNTVAQQNLRIVKGLSRERFTLACRAFRPTDFTRYTNDVFASSPDPAAKSNVIDETTATNALKAFLDKKVALGVITQAKEDATMTRYSSAAAKGTIADHNLRAALFSLVGTFAEGAIASWLDGANVTGKPYTVIAFQDPGDPSVPVAKTDARPSDGRLRTVFRPEFKGEPFQVLSAWVAHEALHQDNSFSLQEEVVADTFGTLALAEQASVDTSFIKTASLLANRENQYLLALINSGRTGWPYPGVKNPNAMLNQSGGVFQFAKAASDGGGVYISFDDFVRRGYLARGAVSGNTAGNALLNQYYNTVTGKTAAANMQFSDQVITDIDTLQFACPTHTAILIAQALRCALS